MAQRGYQERYMLVMASTFTHGNFATERIAGASRSLFLVEASVKGWMKEKKCSESV